MLNSFEKLEIAVALFRSATHTLSLSELETKLSLSSQLVERGLDELARAGVVRLDNGFACLTLNPQEVPAMEEIAALYAEDPLLVVRTLTEIAMDKIRGMTARAFADAFRLRKKEEDNDAG
jgi:hypothetical protein